MQEAKPPLPEKGMHTANFKVGGRTRNIDVATGGTRADTDLLNTKSSNY